MFHESTEGLVSELEHTSSASIETGAKPALSGLSKTGNRAESPFPGVSRLRTLRAASLRN